MRHWLVRAGTPSLDASPDGTTLTFKSRKSPRVAVGDVIVFLEGAKAPLFTRSGTVVRVVPFEGESPDGRRTTRVELQNLTPLSSDVQLEDMQYSLTFVRNTRAPAVHFRRGYRLLPVVDFETLKLAEPFVARTGFYYLINSLPEELRAAFEAEEILGRAHRQRETSSYQRRLEYLHSFIDERIFRAGELLAGLQTILNELGLTDLDGRPLENVVVDEDAAQPSRFARHDDLKEQARRFEGLRHELGEPLPGHQTPEPRDIVQTILTTLTLQDRRPSEERFDRLFEELV